MIDHYATLEIRSDASHEEIRAAYRRLAFVWHPDRNLHRRDEAHRRFLDLNQAYVVLADPERRQRHDQDLFRHQVASSPEPRVRDRKAALWERPARDGEPGFAATPLEGMPLPLEVREREVRRLSLLLASASRGKVLEVFIGTLGGLSFVVALCLLAPLLDPVTFSLRPPVWAPVIAALLGAVLIAWTRAVREIRAQRCRPWAEEILDRRWPLRNPAEESGGVGSGAGGATGSGSDSESQNPA